MKGFARIGREAEDADGSEVASWQGWLHCSK